MVPVNVLAVATAVPPHELEQRAVADAARQIYARTFVRYPKLADVFVNAGIERRYSARSLEWLSAPHNLAERTEVYLESASELFIRTARAALDRARISARDVDVVVTVSSTGIATPGIEAHVGPEMGFRPSVMRVPVFGRGCAGGVSGLTLGARLARAEPGEVVLVVVVELCTLASRTDRGTKADVISSALFGDGAAAAVLRAGPGAAALRVGAAAEHTWPRTLDIMGWMIDPVGFRVMLSRSLPSFVEQRMAAPVRRFIKAARLQAPQLICHPGGAKVLDAIEVALELQKGTLRDEREVLRGHGNMSAPTVLFVLERALRRGLRGPAILSALGPGFTANFLALEAAHG
jgi:alkylresorcinol/alkylpyrone synthase